MNKLEIEHLLTHHQVTSISDVIAFVIQQVQKTLLHHPLESITLRLNQLENQTLNQLENKGLDKVMIQQVKTICQAIIDQRQQTLREDFDQTLNQQWQQIQTTLAAHTQNGQNAQNSKNPRQTLTEIDMLNFFNTNSFNTAVYDDTKKSAFHQQIRKNRDSFKDLFSKQLTRDNLMSDCDRLKQSLQSERKQVNDMKYSLMQMNREISNKITIEEAHSIISEFQSRIFHKIQNEKLELQKLQFNLKKQLQQQILQLRKQTLIDIDFEPVKKQIPAFKKSLQKTQKKLDKYKEQTKSLTKTLKTIEINSKILEKQFHDQKKRFTEYCNSTDQKNQDLSLILEQINQKLSYFDKIDQLQKKTHSFSIQFAKAQWSTQCKTKNDSIIWEKQLVNTNPHLLKFQTQKSQIVISEPGNYLVQFTLFQSKSNQISGLITLQSLVVESSRKQVKLTGSNSLKFIAEVQQKSLIWLKLGENCGAVGNKGILRISKY